MASATTPMSRRVSRNRSVRFILNILYALRGLLSGHQFFFENSGSLARPKNSA